MSQFSPVEGVVTSVTPVQTTADDTSTCTLMLTILGSNGETFNMVLTSDTFILDREPIQKGGIITTFYNTMTPMPLIYPPQYRAVTLVKTRVDQSVMLDSSDRSLLDGGGTLRLNRFDSTDIRLRNGQRFSGALGNQLLLVVYSVITKSIPAQTAPSQIVVFYPVE